jgi:hypothetical protein
MGLIQQKEGILPKFRQIIPVGFVPVRNGLSDTQQLVLCFGN